MKIFTVGTDYNWMGSLVASEKLFDCKVTYIVKDKWEGYYTKIKEMEIELNKLDDNEIVLFTDAYDTMINSNVDEILDKFKSFNCNVLCSAELRCHPSYLNSEMAACFPEELKNKYLNSGGYMGYVKDIKKIFKWKPLDEILELCEKGTDQGYFMEYFIHNHDKVNMKLDTGAVIFQSLFGVSWQELDIRGGRVYNKVYKQHPCILHFNGAAMLCQPNPGEKPADVRWPLLGLIQASKNIPNHIFTMDAHKQGFFPWVHGISGPLPQL